MIFFDRVKLNCSIPIANFPLFRSTLFEERYTSIYYNFYEDSLVLINKKNNVLEVPLYDITYKEAYHGMNQIIEFMCDMKLRPKGNNVNVNPMNKCGHQNFAILKVEKYAER